MPELLPFFLEKPTDEEVDTSQLLKILGLSAGGLAALFALAMLFAKANGNRRQHQLHMPSPQHQTSRGQTYRGGQSRWQDHKAVPYYSRAY
jgi:hypothetical protein